MSKSSFDRVFATRQLFLENQNIPSMEGPPVSLNMNPIVETIVEPHETATEENDRARNS